MRQDLFVADDCRARNHQRGVGDDRRDGCLEHDAGVTADLDDVSELCSVSTSDRTGQCGVCAENHGNGQGRAA